MPITKGKSGGSLKGSRPNNGGARTGSGALVRRIRLSRDAATELRILLLNRRALGGDVDSHRLVDAFVHEKWIEYDVSIERATEALGEAIL